MTRGCRRSAAATSASSMPSAAAAAPPPPASAIAAALCCRAGVGESAGAAHVSLLALSAAGATSSAAGWCGRVASGRWVGRDGLWAGRAAQRCIAGAIDRSGRSPPIMSRGGAARHAQQAEPPMPGGLPAQAAREAAHVCPCLPSSSADLKQWFDIVFIFRQNRQKRTWVAVGHAWRPVARLLRSNSASVAHPGGNSRVQNCRRR